MVARRTLADCFEPLPWPGCWEWTGRYDPGCGRGRWGSRWAHRVVYEALVGPVPEGLELDHLCCNGRCVNPIHLEAVTHAENMRRRSEAQTHCKRGHAFTERNTYRLSGRRFCRQCGSIRQRKAAQRNKEREL